MNDNEFCEDYKQFLDESKTESETVAAAIARAEKAGFTRLVYESGKTAGADLPARFYVNHRGRAAIFFVRGGRPLADGISVIASHADSPRLDLKTRPVFDNGGVTYFDTHYYGMINFHQWTGIPLALHGRVARKDGSVINLRIGEDSGDPVFFIADLLPHLSAARMKGSAKDLIKAEELDVVAGFDSEIILKILRDTYGVADDDFVSAELAVVPAFKARDLGLDRSMIGAYGQDDKVCAYPALQALFGLQKPEYGACFVLADKEETGSMGMTGARSPFFRHFVEEAILGEGAASAPILTAVNRTLENSFCLSADVNAAFDPGRAAIFDAHNEARLGGGVILFRYWGREGKENTNEAAAETTAALRRILDDAHVTWQTGEGGRVDAENSGTMAHFFAEMGIPTVDLGVPILSMHSPFEAAAKADVVSAYNAYTAFFERKIGVVFG